MKPVVLITGASSGIGAALAKVFAAHRLDTSSLWWRGGRIDSRRLPAKSPQPAVPGRP